MKICKKVLIILITTVLMSLTVQSILPQVQATPDGDGDGAGAGGSSSIYSTISSMAEKDAEGGDEAVTSAKNIAGSVISVAKVVCAGIAIIMLSVIAMKYMLAAPSEKADIKKHAVVYVVGAVVMFAATGILSIIQSFASVLE